MPTGYTAGVADGEIKDFRTFALQCARNFGATIMQRDEAMDVPPRHREPSDYDTKALAVARKELARVLKMTDKQCDVEAAKEYEAMLAQHVEHRKKKDETARRYRDMLYEVQKWEPPTSDHRGLKKFMIEQLEESISFDTGYRMEPPKRLTAAEWREEKRRSLERSIARHTQSEQEERERCAQANAWIDALYASLPGAKRVVRRHSHHPGGGR